MSAISNSVSNNSYQSYNSLPMAATSRVGTPVGTPTHQDVKGVGGKTDDFQVDVVEKPEVKPNVTGTGSVAGTEAAKGIQAGASVSIGVNAPTIVTDATDLIPLMESGDFKMAVPLVGGTKLTPLLEIRPDTRAAITFKVEDGKVDFAKTRIFFEKEDGTETDLDGPMFWNPDSIYINAEGHIMADVKCFPDINITKKVLDGVDRVPDTMEGIAKLINKLTGGQTGIMLGGDRLDVDIKPDLPQVQVNGTDISITMPEKEEELPEDATDYSYNPSTDPLEAHKYSLKDIKNDPLKCLMSALELNKTEVAFTGSLKAGPVALGKELKIDVEEGSKVEIKGTPAHMTGSLSLPTKSVIMNANGTMLRGGSGQMSVGLDLSRATDHDNALNFNTPMNIQVAVNAMSLENLYAETPAPSGAKNILEFGKFDLAAEGDPLINLAMKEGQSTLDVVIPRGEWNGLSGQVEITGSDGKPAMFKIGDRALDGQEMKLSVGMELHSADGVFKMDGDVENIAASMDRLAVVDSDCFDLTMSGASISGSGHISVDSSTGKLDLIATDGKPFTVSAGIEDALLGDMSSGGLLVDVADGSHASLAISQLSMGGDKTKPVFRANAEVDVTLDALNLPLGDSGLKLAAGTRGTITIQDMGWKDGAASPDFKGQLRLSLGRDITNLVAGPIAGVDNASIEIDSKSGEASLVLAATLDENGKINCAGGLTFDKTIFNAQVQKGNVQVEKASLEGQTGSAKNIRLNKVRGKVTPPASLKNVSEINVDEVVTSAVPEVKLDMGQIVGLLKQTSINASVPLDKLNGELMSISTKKEVDRWYGSDTKGFEVKVFGKRNAANVSLSLAVEKGALKASSRAINITPPLELNIKGTYWLPVLPGSPSAEANVKISRMEIVIDKKTGKASFKPVFEIENGVTNFIKYFWSDMESSLGNTLGGVVGNALFGSETFDPNFVKLYKKLDENVLSAEPSEPSEIGKQVSAQLSKLMDKVHLDKANFVIAKTELNPGIINLGNGQKLTIGQGSHLNVSGTTDNFIISGDAILGETIIGGKDIGANLRGAKAKLNIKVTGASSGNPQISLVIDDIEADHLSLHGSLKGTNVALNEASVSKGSLRYALDKKGKPIMEFDFPTIKADVALNGGGRIGDMAAKADLFAGKIEGSLSMNSAGIKGKIKNLDISAVGLNFGSPKNPTSVDFILTGAGQITIGNNGNIDFSKLPGRKLDLTARAVLADGSFFEIGNGSVGKFSMDKNGTTISDISASINCVSELATGPKGEKMKLDIRQGRLSGGIKIGESFSTLGDVKIENVDASVTNFIMDNETLGLNLAQFDLKGSGTFNMTEGGEMTIKSATTGSLSMAARADDMKFSIPEPSLNLDLAEGLTLAGKVDYFSVGGPKGPALQATNGHFYGAIDAGRVAMPMGSGKLAAVIARGSSVSADFDISYGLSKEPKLDIKLGLEGGFDVGASNMAAISANPVDFNVTKVDTKGDFKMQLNAKMDGKGGFAASTALKLDGKLGFAGQGQSKLQLGE